MAKRLKPVDVVTIGVGLTGALAALELAETGLKIVGLERGAPRDTVPDFQSPQIHDELRYAVRKALMQNNAKVAVTFATAPTRRRCQSAAGRASCRDRGSVARSSTGTGRASAPRCPISSTAPITWNATARNSLKRVVPNSPFRIGA